MKSVSFKRKQKAPSLAGRLPSSPFSQSRTESPLSRPASARQQRERARASANPSTGAILSYLNQPADGGIGVQDAKDPSALDWYVEGPGRRVGYEDLTAIDWIFEYAKERQRLRSLAANATGLLGYARQLADSSQVWIILILTGIAVGTLAAGIDVASDWLGDLKSGYCSNVAFGGKFYLNKNFCCWGLDSTCCHLNVLQRNGTLNRHRSR